MTRRQQVEPGDHPRSDRPQAGSESSRVGDALHELAEDMLDVMQRLGTAEQLLHDTTAVLDRLTRLVEHGAAQQARSMEQLRQDLTGERRGLIVRGLFDSVVTALDSLEILARACESDGQPLGMQLQATCATLGNLLRSIGFSRFDVARGDTFQPARMQCFGYAEGPAGVVLEAVQPGYAASDTVVRPAGVLIADPTSGPTAAPVDRRADAEEGD
jgi:molecular chaperone GrpE (heat shock protein)